MSHSKPPSGAPQRNYEDIDVATIVRYAMYLVLVMLVAYLLVGALFIGLEARRKAHDTQPSPLASLRPIGVPAPRLQTDERNEIKVVHEEERGNLYSYGWVNREAGAVRIPIDVAMAITAQRGSAFPATQPAGGGK